MMFKILAMRCSIRSRYMSTMFNQSLETLKINNLTGTHEGICVVSFDRPNVRNAISRAAIRELSSIVEELKFKKDVRVIVFSSTSPGVFCAGADLKERQTLSQAEAYQMVLRFRELSNDIEFLPMPTIAAIDGVALGGGLEIALACDMRVASSNVNMGLVETRLAIMPGAGGTQRLPRLIGSARAKELIFTARIIDANTAFNYGILNHVVQQNDKKDAAYLKALEIAKEILPNGPDGIRLAKKAITGGLHMDISSGCIIEENCYAQTLPLKDRLEGISAFLEKRPPKYKGE